MKAKIILLSLLVVLFSCKKQQPQQVGPIPTLNSKEEPTLQMWGKWKLTQGWMYFENLETGEKYKYTHFDGIQTTSSLRWSSPLFEIERIVQNQTTWEFIPLSSDNGIHDFMLNDSTLMGFNLTNSYRTIVEHPTANSALNMHLGGSARPLGVWTEDNVHMIVRLQEFYDSFNGYNWKLFSVLEFKQIN